MRQKARSMLGVLLGICMLLFWGSMVVQAEDKIASKEKKKIRVAVTNYPNYMQMHKDGDVSGFAIDYLDQIAQYTGWEYEYEVMSFADACQALADGTIDILPGCQYTEERSEKYDFSSESMGQGGTVLCARKEDDRYLFNDFENYQGMKIAALSGSIRIKQTKDILEKYGTTVEFIEYDTDEGSKEALENGQVDAALMSMIRCENSYKIIARTENLPLYFMLNQSKPEMKKQLDYAMYQMDLISPYYGLELEKRYYGDIISQSPLTREEEEYVKSCGVLKVSISTQMCPSEYFDKEIGTYKGIIPDSYEKISEYTGLQFEYVERTNISELKNQLLAGEIQLVSSVANFQSAAEQLGVKLTIPFSNNSCSMVMAENTLTNLESNQLTAVIMKEMPLFEEIVGHSYPNSRLEYRDTFEECVEEVDSGNCDYTIIPTYSVNYYLDHSYYKKIHSYVLSDSKYELCVGVADGADQRLYSILNKAVAAITEDEQNAIIMQNIAAVDAPKDWRDYISDNLPLFYVCVSILAMGGIAIALYFTRKQKIVNSKLMDAKQEADQANQTKSLFLAKMSHDIRTPLNAIVGITNLILNGDSTDILKDVKKVNNSAHFLMHLVNDILDTTKLEQGKITLSPEPYNYSDLKEYVDSLIVPMCSEKRQKFELRAECLKNVTLMADHLRFNQIIMNLISNAVKFTPEGGKITFAVENEVVKEKMFMADFIFEDSGYGMSEEFQKHMFEAFAREHNNLTYQVAGSGLGLNIVKQIVKLNGGTIQVKSESGKGTKFILHLCFPITEQQKKKAQKENEMDCIHLLKKKRILVCEDHPLNQEIIKRLLEKLQMEVTLAEDGIVGLACFTNAPAGYFHAVLMDIRMPNMDGLNCAQKIRALEDDWAKKVPIIAMTANAYEEDKEKSRQAGMNAHLAKPVEPQLLYATLAKFISESSLN